MKMKKDMMAIKDLQVNLFVRKVLNQDHVLYLGQLVEGGVNLPPIKINQDLVVIDGRHRIEAYELLGRTQIEAVMVDTAGEK